MSAEENGELDRLLEQGLASYSSHEPRPGMERRVLAACVRPKRAIWRWAFAAAAILLVTGLAVTWRTERAPAPAVAVRKTIEQRLPESPLPRSKPTPARVRRRRSLPKRDEFPSPSPLTGEERALLSLVERAPDQALELFDRETKPISIEAITIQPLE